MPPVSQTVGGFPAPELHFGSRANGRRVEDKKALKPSSKNQVAAETKEAVIEEGRKQRRTGAKARFHKKMADRPKVDFWA